MAYHLSRDAREGLAEFRIPPIFGNQLFEFQAAAARIAAHHINRRGGALIGDVVGLGKTLMATAVAKILEDDYGLETLILCPKNLTEMWKDYAYRYQLRAEVMSISVAINRLPDLRRYRVVVVDESHNLRNPEGRTYRAIREYIAANESRCVLLSATPYNKTYTDLSAQLGLFTPSEHDLGVRPERQLREIGETEFVRQHQCGLSTLAAFEHTEFADDWRELMRLYMVRRTRSFIKDNYALTDPDNDRKYLQFPDETRSYFPDRVPRTLRFAIDPGDPVDQYARMFSDRVVAVVNALKLPRYGLANYVESSPEPPPTQAEQRRIDDLNRAGRRLQGFCRTNLFKRLESSGPAFLQSVERHILRNLLVLHAVEHGLDVPIGTQSADDLDTRQTDADRSAARLQFDAEGDEDAAAAIGAYTDEALQRRAADAYARLAGPLRSRYDWLRTDLFKPDLAADLRADAQALLGVLVDAGPWDPSHDAKLTRLQQLLTRDHPHDKVLVFSQFAHTVDYLTAQLRDGAMSRPAVEKLEGVTGASENPTAAARRFSPVSNGVRDRVPEGQELRVVIATDVLSEGQNLQDCAIVVNYDLPWAIIRLAQRAGRVDRIGQTAARILCYSFLPADGVERVLRLRSRVRQRLHENAEVVGTDEAYFADDDDRPILDLYNERAGVLDGDEDTEIDLASYAFQIWKNATDDNPSLRRQIEKLPDVVYSARTLPLRNSSESGNPPSPAADPPGAFIYLRTAADNDTLIRVNADGETVSQSHFAILNAARCAPGTPPAPRHPRHHEFVASAVRKAASEEKQVGGQLGRPSGARFRVYERLKNHIERNRGQLFVTPELERAHQAIYRFPLRAASTDTLNRQLRSGASDEALAELVTLLHAEDRLCLTQDDDSQREPQIICLAGPARARRRGLTVVFRAEPVRQAIQDFDFERLFLDELGWDHPPANQSVPVEGLNYHLEAVAEKSGLAAYIHRSAIVPPRALRMRIERGLAKQVHEHLLVFVDDARTRQVWQWVKRQAGQTPRYREHTFYQGQTGELLVQKLQPLAFSLDEEPSIAEVTERMSKGLNVDRVTRRFFDRFKTEHKAFLKLVKGIRVKGDREWYASLMLKPADVRLLRTEEALPGQRPRVSVEPAQGNQAAVRSRPILRVLSPLSSPLLPRGTWAAS